MRDPGAGRQAHASCGLRSHEGCKGAAICGGAPRADFSRGSYDGRLSGSCVVCGSGSAHMESLIT